MFRIYTEDVNRQAIEAILSRHFDGYTLLPARGVWKGAAEDSLVIEIDGADAADVQQAAREIKKVNHQQAVLIAEVPAQTVLV